MKHFEEIKKEILKRAKDAEACTHIYMLKDWKDSKGAMMEHQFAIDNGIEVIYE